MRIFNKTIQLRSLFCVVKKSQYFNTILSQGLQEHPGGSWALCSIRPATSLCVFGVRFTRGTHLLREETRKLRKTKRCQVETKSTAACARERTKTRTVRPVVSDDSVGATRRSPDAEPIAITSYSSARRM